MTKEELDKLKQTIAYFGHWYDVIGEERVSILEKAIAYIDELEQQIEKMKCCRNCGRRNSSLCGSCKRLKGQTFSDILTSDNWELKEE